MGWRTLGSVGGLVRAAGEVSLVLLCQKQVEEGPPSLDLFIFSDRVLRNHRALLSCHGAEGKCDWMRRIHSTGSPLAQLQLPLQPLLPVSSGWSHFFMVDPSFLFRKIVLMLGFKWGPPGRACYKYRLWPPSSVHQINMIWGGAQESEL